MKKAALIIAVVISVALSSCAGNDLLNCSNPGNPQMVIAYDKERKEIMVTDHGIQGIRVTLSEDGHSMVMYPCDSIWVKVK